MKVHYSFLSVLLFWVLTACSSSSEIEPSITVNTPEEKMELSADINSRIEIAFSSTHPWTATIDGNWAVLSPSSGAAGENTVAILSKEKNLTGELRTLTLTLKIASENVSVSKRVRQAFTDVLNVAQTKYETPAAGGAVEIEYSTNLTNALITLEFEGEKESWVQIEDKQSTRALQAGKFNVQVSANRRLKARTARMLLIATDATNPQNVLMKTAVSIAQEAATVGYSKDLTTDDKKVTQLLHHTEGNGVPLVFVGDGFLDVDISGGYYKQVMEKAVEHFFSEEPVKSLRAYFDVWMVTAVSTNNAFGSTYSTKFACKLEGGGSTGISGNHDLVREYARAVPELGGNPDLLDQTLVIVVLNSEEYAGTAYFGFTSENTGTTNEFAIGYCPTIYGLEDEMFRRVLCHECIGHGFTKLMDEYSYQEQGTIPDAEVQSYRQMQQAMGWAMNVDFTYDKEKVLWSKFLNDSRYQQADAYGETLGVYEGACTYWRGAFRPTNESMMRSNTNGFNAPSREAIYKRVMRMAYGKSWQYDYETFVKFEQTYLGNKTNTRGVISKPSKPFAPPRMVNKLSFK